MKPWTTVTALMLFALTALTGTANFSYAETANEWLRIADGAQVELTDIAPDLQRAGFVFVGEFHDRARDHAVQLKVIRTLAQSGDTLAIGLEMFRRDQQQVLDRWIAGELDEQSFTKAYYENWNFPWPLYRDIFLYAKEKGIPMIGLNIPRELTYQVARKGFSSLSPEQAKGLPPVTCVVDRKYQVFIERALGAHAHGAMQFTHFCEAQLLWDTAMAWHLLEYLNEHPGTRTVVLAGKAHAWKQGIPSHIERDTQLEIRVILPSDGQGSEGDHIGTADADYLWLH